MRRKPFYALAEVVRLTRSTEADIAVAIRDGAVDPVRDESGPRFAWEDVALLALRRWTPRMIEGALDLEYRDVVPLLNRMKQIVLHLPLYQIRLLHVLAQSGRAGFRGRLNASDVLEQELVEIAAEMDAEEIELEIPGFRAALHYPYFIPRDDDRATAFCRFCGRISGVAEREICDDCKQRHEPEMHRGVHGMPELDKEDE